MTSTDTTPDPVAEAFAGLIRALRMAALDAPLNSNRESAFLVAARRMSERWTAGERSPARTSAAKEG